MILVKMMFSVFCVLLLSASLAATSEGTTLPLSTVEVTVDMKESTENPENTYACLMYRLEDKLDRMEEKMAELERKANASTTDEPYKNKQYAFSAYMSLNNSGLRSGGDLKFTQVITNVGGAYNEHTGVFTSPANGVYEFTYKGLGYVTSASCFLTLFHNNSTLVSSYSYSKYGYPMPGNSVVVELGKYDVVHVGITGSSACYLRGGKYVTFTGTKLE